MPFISYAQNLEDVVLYRALREVRQGFYVDVGANSPDEHSVTRAFYDRGWRGINIEPAPSFHEQLAAARPDDVNLAVAVGDHAGSILFHDIAGTGLSTADPETARLHRQSGYPVIERDVPLDTLDNILAKHAARRVHFLKIDVEGLEEAVLRGISLVDPRPWIIVVEATKVLSQTGNHVAWDSLLTGRGYRFVYFDGLNRFYLAEEKSELACRFDSPPNIFDDWIRKHDWAAHELVGNLSRRIEGEEAVRQGERRDRRAEVETRREEVAVRGAEAAARLGELEVRRAEDAARQADTEVRKAEAAVRSGEVEARLREAEARGAEIGQRRAETKARFAEALSRKREAALRDRESLQRDAELRMRQAEVEARLAEIDMRRAELAGREAETAAWRAELQARHEEWRRITAENDTLRQRIAELEATAASLDSYIRAVRVSASWRVTAPLRGIKRMLVASGAAVRRTGTPPLRARLVSAARRCAAWAAGQSRIRRALLPVVLRVPRLESIARRLLAPRHAAARANIPSPPDAHQPEPPVPADAPIHAGSESAPAGPGLVPGSLSEAEREVEAALLRAMARAR